MPELRLGDHKEGWAGEASRNEAPMTGCGAGIGLDDRWVSMSVLGICIHGLDCLSST